MADITIIFTVTIYNQELENRVMRPLNSGATVTKRRIESTEEFNWGKEKYHYYGYEYTVKYNKDNKYKWKQAKQSVTTSLNDLNYDLNDGNDNTNKLYYHMSPRETIINMVKRNFKIVFGRNLRIRQRQQTTQTTQTTDKNKRRRFLL